MAANFEATREALVDVKSEVREEIVAEVCREIKEVFEGLTEQPPGRLLDREVEVRETMLRLGGRLLEGLLQVWGTGYAGSRLPCACGEEQRFAGNRPRSPLSLLGPVSFTRAYYHCGSCQEGASPLDAILGLGSRDETEGVQRCLGRLGAAMTFAEAAATMEKVGGIGVSAKCVDRVVQDLGGEIGERLTQEQEEVLRGEAVADVEEVDRLYVTMDAVKVPT